MKKKPANRFDVYEFDESDEFVQKSAEKIINRYNPKSVVINKPKKKSDSLSPITKYSFLRCFANGTDSKADKVFNDRLEVEVDGFVSSGSSNCVPATCNKSELVTINIEDDDVESSALTSSSRLAGNEGGLEQQALEHRFSGWAIDDEVIIYPDYILSGRICSAASTQSQITFSSSSIKIECSFVYGYEEPFRIECRVDDVIKIESQWCGQFLTAIVDLYFKLEDKKLAEVADMSRGIAKLRFAVFDHCWHKKLEEIKLLNTRYETKWDLVSDIDTRSKDDCLEKNNIFISKHNFPNPNGSLKEVVYPRGDPDAVSVYGRDIELLQPETFVNDTIIDFYIKYLQNKIKPHEKHRFHFFNCFFFRKLADLDKDPCGAGDGRAAFQRVRKWTRKVDLFEKDYIFIPVNFSLHWSLIVICNPGEAVNFKDEDMQKLPKAPCILHMDSIKGSHRGLRNLFQIYLWEEWKERGNQPDDISSKFLNLRFVPLELPQQENSFDCGIFLLHYMELFLEQVPVCFNPFKKAEFPNFLSKDWFPPVEASQKRAYIKNLINQIAENYQENPPPASCDGDEHLSSEVRIIEKGGADAELPEEICRSPETDSSCHSSYFSSFSDQENDTEQLRETPHRGNIECSKEHNYCRSSLFDESCSFGQLVLRDRPENIMTPIEEVEENSEQQAKKKVEGSSSSEKEVNKNILFGDIFGPNSSEMNAMSKSPSTANSELATCIVEDSEEEDGVIDITDDERSLFGLRKVDASKQEGDCIIVRVDGLAPVLKSDKRLGSKRRSPMPPEGIRRRFRSSSKDLHEVFICE